MILNKECDEGNSKKCKETAIW